MTKVALIDKIYSKKMINKINSKLELLGDDYKYNVKFILNIRTFGTILIFLIFIIFNKHGYIYAPLFALIYYYTITYLLLDYPIKKRRLILEHEAIFFFEILELTLESGKTLNQALEITAKNVDGQLSKEFLKTLNEVKMGKSLVESLKVMKYRIPSKAINNTILNLTESSIFGSNIIDSLNNQLEYLRNKQLMEIKGRINKLPTKISVISVVFFIPLLLLIILSPVIINFLSQ
jgi:tight adherence protein C